MSLSLLNATILNRFYVNSLFFLLFLVIIDQTSTAQNYRNVPVHGNLYFIDSLNYIFPIDPDTIKFENGDSVIYHFKSMRPSQYLDTTRIDTSVYALELYYNLLGDSWAGNRTILKSDASTVWFAKDNDSLVVKNLAKTGEIWTVNGKRNFYGKVTDHVLMTFLGITDSVKYLTIGSLNTLTGEVIGKEFWLSKNYGFIKMPDIYNFFITSSAGNNYHFWGAAQNFYKYPYTGPIGNTTLIGSKLITSTKTKLTERMVNDFEVGDEFHKSSKDVTGFGCEDNYSPKPYLTGQYEYENLIIKSKTINTQMDTAAYEVQLCGNNTNYYSYPNFTEYTSFNETKILKLPFHDTGHIPLKVYFPAPGSETISGVTIHLTISTLTIKDGLYFESIIDFIPHGFCSGNIYKSDTASTLDCYEITPSNLITCGNQIIEGTGYGYFDFEGECGYSTNCLNYFKKGSIIWGIPNNFNCDTLTTRTILGINENNLQKSITIKPNPFSETINIKSDGKIQNVNIYNLQMQLIQMTQSINNQELVLNLNNLPSGMYIAEVILTDQRKAQHKIIKLD